MSGGSGSILHMIVSNRNNLEMRGKKSVYKMDQRFFNIYREQLKNTKKLIDKNKLSPFEIEKLKNKYRKEAKKRRVIQSIVLIIFMGVAVIFTYFLIQNIFFTEKPVTKNSIEGWSEELNALLDKKANRADYFLEMHELDSAIFYCVKGLEIESNNYRLNYILAKSYVEKSVVNESYFTMAECQLKAMLEYYKNELDVYFLLADLYHMHEENIKAEKMNQYISYQLIQNRSH